MTKSTRPANTLRILHISDLHSGKEGRSGAQWRMRRVLGDAWTANLQAIAEDGKPDLICFTGDLAQSGLAHEYDDVSAFLDEMLATLQVSKERLFVVPGNHDIHRDTHQSEWAALRGAVAAINSDAVSAWVAGDGLPFGFDPSWRDQIVARQHNYRNWLADYGLFHAIPGHSGHPHLGYRHTLTGWGPLLHIIGLDSAWLAGDNHDARKLRLTDDQIGRLLTAQGDPLLGIKIVLLHHPLDELADGTPARHLLAEYGVHLVLHGHVHDPNYQRWQHPNRATGGLQEGVAGCLYQHDRYPNCIQVIDLAIASPDVCLPRQLWLRGWSPKGHWHDDDSHYKGSRRGRLPLADAESPPAIPPGALLGREAQIQALREALLAPDKSVQTVALCCAIEGMPGVGKTRLAEAFIADHWAPALEREVADSHARLFLSENSPTTAPALGHQVADLLGLAATSQELWLALVERLQRPRTLLLIENVDTPALADAVGQMVANLPGCPIMITARYRYVGWGAAWRQILVDPLTPEASLALLRAEAPESAASDAELRCLALQLGYLPLALHIAASHLALGSSPALFLDELRQHGFRLPPANPADPTLNADRARAILHSSFALSWATWSKQQAAFPALRDALAAFSHGPAAGCGPALGAVVVGLLAPDRLDGPVPLDYERMCLGATRLSLAEYQHQTRHLRLHPLLGEWLRAQTPEQRPLAEERWQAWLMARLPNLTDIAAQGRSWRAVQIEQPALTDWLGRCSVDMGRALLEHAGNDFATACGPYEAWKALCQRLLVDLGEEDPARSTVWWRLGNVALHAGELDVTIQAVEALGQERDWAAMTASLKADVFFARGDLDEVVRILREEELPIRDECGDALGRARAAGKIADVFYYRGEFDEALRIRREEELPIYEQLGLERSRAITLGRIADTLYDRGEFDEALRIRREEELPIYDTLGDVRERAVVLGKIADVLRIQEDFEEALRLLVDEVLPAFERLGNVRLRGVALGKIADVFYYRGDIDESLRIRREEELPVYDKLGDARERAIALGKIAASLYDRGDFDEALRIRREEELPVYERLGAERLSASTLGEIVDMFCDKGDLDEALRIHRDEELPVYEKLGDVRGRAEAQSRVAKKLYEREAFDRALHMLREEVLPTIERLGDVRDRAVVLGNIATLLCDKGDFDEALRIQRDEELPVYEKLGDVALLTAGRTNLARTLEGRKLPGDLAEARRLLELALPDAIRLDSPLVQEIEGLLARLGN